MHSSAAACSSPSKRSWVAAGGYLDPSMYLSAADRRPVRSTHSLADHRMARPQLLQPKSQQLSTTSPPLGSLAAAACVTADCPASDHKRRLSPACSHRNATGRY